MAVTEAEIDAAKTEFGGWTRETLAEWGIPWPPKSGWRQRLVQGETERLRVLVEEGGENFYRVTAQGNPELRAVIMALPQASRFWRSDKKAWFVRRAKMKELTLMLRAAGVKVRWVLAPDLPMPRESSGHSERRPRRVLHLRQSAPSEVIRAAYLTLKSLPNADHRELDQAYAALTA